MKKLNLLKTAAALFASAVLLFTSCSSSPDILPVDALDLLEANAALYVAIPVQSNSEVVEGAIKKITTASDSDAKKIAERLDTLFLSVDLNGQSQLSCSGKIPANMAGMAFTEKNGWKSQMLSNQIVYKHTQSNFQICLPSSKNAFLGQNIEPMIQRYNFLAYPPSSQENGNPLSDNSSASSMELVSNTMVESAYKLLHDDLATDMVIYAPLPRAFLRSFIGSDIKTPVDSIVALLSRKDLNSKQYNVKLIITMSDHRTVKATCALLKTLLFPIPAKIQQTGQSQITVTDLPVAQSKILSFFGIK